jgi:nitric oxide reductase NorQ protein
VLQAEAGIDLTVARRLVKCATSIRTADDAFHLEGPSTRVLVAAAKLVAAGATELEAAEVCILAPLSNDGAIADGLRELATASLGRGALSEGPAAGRARVLR